MSRRRTSTRRSNQSSGGVVLLLVVLVAAYFIYQQLKSDTTSAPASAPTLASGQPAAPSTQPAPGGEAGAWYQLFFTTPRYPDKPEYHHGGMDEQLVAFLNTATQTIDVADYDFDL